MLTITISEICEILGVSRNWVNQYITPNCNRIENFAGKIRYNEFDIDDVAAYLCKIARVSNVHTFVDAISYTDNPKRTQSHYNKWIEATCDDSLNTLKVSHIEKEFAETLPPDGKAFYKKHVDSMDSRKRLPDKLINDPEIIAYAHELIKKSLLFKERQFRIIKDFEFKSLELAYREIYRPGWYILRIHGRSYYFESDFIFKNNENMKCPLPIARILLDEETPKKVTRSRETKSREMTSEEIENYEQMTEHCTQLTLPGID